MKGPLIIIFLTSVVCCNLAPAQTAKPFLHEYNKGRSVLLYSYIQRHDSTFLMGNVREKGSAQPIVNMNIIVKGFPVGTVPDSYGNFTIFLPVKEGVITFDKANYAHFEFAFKYRKEDSKSPTAHH